MRFMITFQNRRTVFFALSTIVFCLLVGCKRTSKEISERMIREGTEETTEYVSQIVGKSSLKEMGDLGIRNLSYEDFVSLLKRDFPSIYTSFSFFEKSVQQDILKTINNNPKLLDVLTTSKTLIDEFIVATAKTPSLTQNASFFAYYITHPQIVSEYFFEQTDNTVKFLSKIDNKVYGKYNDGILEAIGTFNKGRSFNNNLLNGDLIPNTLYKVKGEMGTLYLLQTDAIGNVITAQGRYLTPEDIVMNILRRNTDINLGSSWPASYKKIKQYSTGADLDVSIRFNYSEGNPNPRSVKMVVKKGDKAILDELFDNLNYLLPTRYSSAQNASLLKSLQNKLSIPEEKIITLRNLMDADNGFSNFIHSNPEYNIKRWLKTRNHVDQRLITKTPNGRLPINARTYAGNVYYFNPYLNPALANRLSNKNGMATLKKAGILSREQLEELDRVYPNGVPFSKSGFPDFSGVAAKGGDGKPIAIDIGNLSGDSKVDIAIAEKLYQSKGNQWEDGFTWHHIEGTTSLLRVPTIIHQLVDHTGGMAMSK